MYLEIVIGNNWLVLKAKILFIVRMNVLEMYWRWSIVFIVCIEVIVSLKEIVN